MPTKRKTRSSRLLDLLADYDQVIIVTHDNPDPDAIASGWALAVLVREKLGMQPRLVGAGTITRAENRRMVQLLEPPLELVSHLAVDDEAAAILVDCSLNATHHVLNGSAARPVAVIDHHATDHRASRLPFEDVRPRVAASATIAASYLKDQAIVPSEALATALVYAIRTETRGNETHHTRLDRSMISWLTGFANPTLLAEIENAPLSREYYGDLVLSLQNTFLYDDAALCLLPRAEGPETVGEVADMLIRCEGVNRVFCGAAYDNQVLVSVRTQRPDDSAADLVRRTLKDLGFGGGHLHRAGGKIPNVTAGRITEALEDDLRARWLDACDVDRSRGTRLVARREIIENL